MDNKKYWLSVIIPAHNCAKTIERLLDSILAQNMNNDIEVLICDDNSTDGFIEKVRPYANRLHILYTKTEPREIHCPGNTRMDGWAHSTGEWITFIDHDDVFEPDKFRAIKESIKENPTANLVFANFREVSEDQSTVLEEYKFQLTWMHGKFYKRSWLIENGIDFKENLVTHEDLYFNSQVFANIYKIDESYLKYDEFVYRWINIPTSTSRAKYTSDNNHLFLEENFEDYTAASFDSWMEMYVKNKNIIKEKIKDIFFVQFCSIMLYHYFYYEGFVWLFGRDKVRPVILEAVRFKLYKILNEFDATKEDIINQIHKSPEYYIDSKHTTQLAVGRFIESDSFDDFIRNL